MRKYILNLFLLVCPLCLSAQNKVLPDSLNIPVFLVDGVEVTTLNDIDWNDVEHVDVIKNDPKVLALFAPRRGGVLVITTKSKQKLRSMVEKYERDKARMRQKNSRKKQKGKPKTIYIR